MKQCSIFIITLISALVHSVINKEKDPNNVTTLEIINGLYPIKDGNVTFMNNKNPNVDFSKTGKVWHFKSKDDLNILIEQYLIVSHYYIFLFDNFELFEYFITIQIQYQLFINGIIVTNNSEFNDEKAKAVILFSNYSIFMYANNSINALDIYDIRNEDNNYFIHLSYSLIIYIMPLNYLKWMSIVGLVLSLILPVWWNIKLRYTPEDSQLLLQKVIVFLPYLNVIVTGMIVFQMFSIKDRGGTISNTSNIYIETVLVTIRAIFRTLLWFFIILVASGWQLVVRTLSRDDIKSYIKIYVFIYIVICVDQIVDAFSGTILKIFYPSEIKNILFYFLMALGVLQKGLKTLKFLKTKLRYARIFTQEYIPSLYIKQKMMLFHIAGVIVYFGLYCIEMIIQKVFFTDYNVEEFILVNYHFLDLLLVVYYLIVYHPRKLPNYFNIEYGDDEEEIAEFGLFKSKIPNINEITKEDNVIMLSQPELFDLNQDNTIKRMPIVVINPVIPQAEDGNKNTINLIIDHLAVGYISS